MSDVSNPLGADNGGGFLTAEPRSLVHQITSGPHMLPCPECGQTYNGPTGLGVHRSIRHGVQGTKSHPPTGRKRGRPRKTEAKTPRTTRLPSSAGYDPDWSIDDVFDAVVSIMWPQPQGTMPIAALPILLRWRDDTQRMLRDLEMLSYDGPA